MVEVKNNKTIQWLNSLSSEKQLTIINFAVDSKEDVSKAKEEWLCKKRQEKMVKCHIHREALKRKVQVEREKLTFNYKL